MKTMHYLFLSILGNMFLFYVIGYMYSINRSLKKKLKECKPSQPVITADTIDIVGKSRTSFLAPIAEPDVAPELEPLPAPEPVVTTETEILPEEVEHKVSKLEVSDVEELATYLGHNDGSMEDVGEINQGLTFEEIGHAIDVVRAGKKGDNDIARAGKTFALMPSDFIDVVCSNNIFSDRVYELIKNHVDGSVPKKSYHVKDFKIENYV